MWKYCVKKKCRERLWFRGELRFVSFGLQWFSAADTRSFLTLEFCALLTSISTLGGSCSF